MDFNENNELERRELRRKRRIRAQATAYISLVIILLVVGAAGYFGVKEAVSFIEKYNQKTVVTEQAEAENVTEQVEADTSVDTQEVTNEQPEEVTQEPEVTGPDELDELVDVLIADMTLEEKVAGLFLVTPEAITGVTTAIQAGNSTKKAIEENPVGGLIYAKKNYTSKAQFQEMVTNTMGFSKFPLFIAIDRECGSDTSFDISTTDKASDLIEEANVGVVYSIVAAGVEDIYVNMLLAPVADIVSEDGNSKLQGRTFGSDAASVSRLVSKAVGTIQEVADSVVKTFPGEGSVNTDNELTKSLEELKNAELISFEGAVNAGASSIMVSSLYATGITGEKIPACLSPEVIAILRDYLQFNGIIMTDYLDEDTITKNFSSGEAAVKAIEAGADMLLSPKSYKEAYQGIIKAIEEGVLTEERINESIHRIYRIKYKNALESI